MPIVDDGMTEQEAELLTKPAPKGDYIIELTGLLKVEGDTNPETMFVHTKEETGNRMYKVSSKIVSSAPDKDGNVETVHANKPVKTYNAVWGTGLLASFKRGFPECLTEDGKVKNIS